MYRIWSGIEVKCVNHEEGCSWTGSIVDFSKHEKSCQQREKGNTLALKERVIELEIENAAAHILMCTLQQEHEEAEEAIFRLQHQCSEALTCANAVDENHVIVPKLFFEGVYNYKRENVVQLSQLISRYLENKPVNIESHRIYQCVANCYSALKSDRRDNPAHYYDDMRMLLTTCAASATWFSVRQMGNMNAWLAERGWNH